MYAPPTLFWYTAFCFPATYNPSPTWGVPCNQLPEEETLGPGCRMCRHYPEADSSSMMVSLWDILQDSDEGKSSQWTEPQAVLLVHLCWETQSCVCSLLPLLDLLRVGLEARTLYHQEVKKPPQPMPWFWGSNFPCYNLYQ